MRTYVVKKKFKMVLVPLFFVYFAYMVLSVVMAFIFFPTANVVYQS